MGEWSAAPRVVIVGAGFGGLTAARALRKAAVSVLMVDRYNFHTFQPLLYQVATAGLEPEEIAHTVRGIFHGQENFDFRLGTVAGIDLAARRLRLQDGGEIAWDSLILAAGAENNDFGVPGVAEHAYSLKELPEAVALRNHVISRFEAAAADPAEIERGALRFVIVGGGPTGVEMAGALSELIDQVLTRDFPYLDLSRAEVVLVERDDKLLAPFAPRSQAHAREVLGRRGVELRFGDSVVAATATEVTLGSGERLPAQTLIWAAGVRGNPLAQVLAQQGVELVRGGRVKVEPDLSLPGHREVFVIGDLAGSSENGALHPQLAPVAMQGAKHAAAQIRRRLEGQPTQAFLYKDRGTMATIGRNAAVAEFPNGPRFTGWIGWLLWLFLHLMLLVGFRNRLNVFVNWAYNYLTYDRSARLILERGLLRERSSRDVAPV